MRAKFICLEGLPSGKRAAHLRFRPSIFCDTSERYFSADNHPSMAVFWMAQSSSPTFHDELGIASPIKSLIGLRIVAKFTWSSIVRMGDGSSEGSASPDGCVPLAAVKRTAESSRPRGGIQSFKSGPFRGRVGGPSFWTTQGPKDTTSVDSHLSTDGASPEGTEGSFSRRPSSPCIDVWNSFNVG